MLGIRRLENAVWYGILRANLRGRKDMKWMYSTLLDLNRWSLFNNKQDTFSSLCTASFPLQNDHDAHKTQKHSFHPWVFR